MRDYGKVKPKFWIGHTGRKLRGHMEAQIVASYLITSPHANMIGLYYLPVAFIVHETGLTEEGASKGLRRASEVGFCSYDEESEVVWVHEMARFQIGDDLKPSDNRCLGIQREYDEVPQCVHLEAFFEKYAKAFHLTKCRRETSPSEAPFKPLRSQEQEQEKEQEKDSPPAPPEWDDETVAYLRIGGRDTARDVRATLAELEKRHSREEILSAIDQARCSAAAKPLAFVGGCLSRQRATRPLNGSLRPRNPTDAQIAAVVERFNARERAEQEAQGNA